MNQLPVEAMSNTKIREAIIRILREFPATAVGAKLALQEETVPDSGNTRYYFTTPNVTLCFKTGNPKLIFAIERAPVISDEQVGALLKQIFMETGVLIQPMAMRVTDWTEQLGTVLTYLNSAALSMEVMLSAIVEMECAIKPQLVQKTEAADSLIALTWRCLKDLAFLTNPATYQKFRLLEPGQISEASYRASEDLPDDLESAEAEAVKCIGEAAAFLKEMPFACPQDFTEDHFRFFAVDMVPVLETATKVLSLTLAEVREAIK